MVSKRIPAKLSQDEASLLLYLECRAVDHAGIVDMARMNTDDVKTAEQWTRDGFIEFGRIAYKDIQGKERMSSLQSSPTHWVRLTPKAWKVAHVERCARAERMWKKRSYSTTAEISAEVW